MDGLELNKKCTRARTLTHTPTLTHASKNLHNPQKKKIYREEILREAREDSYTPEGTESSKRQNEIAQPRNNR